MTHPGSRQRLARLHASLAVAAVICATGFTIELWRAIDGNELSWAYVFEWPLFLAYGTYMWRRLVREERGQAPPRPLEAASDVEVAELEAWNRYLAALHAREGTTRPRRDAP